MGTLKPVDIDFALVEEKRPPIYTAMKYWGKKPHNIWRAYIENYVPKNGVCLDPFSGSAMGAFESAKIGRKAVAFDINPLTSFIIEVFCSTFKHKEFSEICNGILEKVKQDSIYQYYFLCICPKCLKAKAVIETFKWDSGVIYSVGISCPNCGRIVSPPTTEIIKKSTEFLKIKIPFWYPDEPFYESPSFGKSFIKNIGGSTFSNIWTRRNLYVLSLVFNEILRISNSDIKRQLLFGFIQSVHLCSKMCVPRRAEAKRDFSTSWGRAAYLCSSRQMEMNPYIVFERSCLNKKQSVVGALSAFKTYVGKIPKLMYVHSGNRTDRRGNWDLKYGIIDINTLPDYIDAKSIDFILTDPPYGGLVQYLDLSYLWLIWLKKYDNRFTPNIAAEITIKDKIQPVNVYQRRFANGLKNLYKVLKDDGKIVFTFHNKNIQIWNAFLLAIAEAGFRIEKIIHQQNRRTGESNVANPYGTSASDFYIRCSKSTIKTNLRTTHDYLENFIVDRVEKIIIVRGEPTPFQILFNGVLAELSRAGLNLENFDVNIQEILAKHLGLEFVVLPSENDYAGALWDLKDARKRKSTIALSARVEKSIIKLLVRDVAVSLDQVLAEIFVKYPNGLTPDIRTVQSILTKHAIKSGQKWIYRAARPGKIHDKQI